MKFSQHVAIYTSVFTLSVLLTSIDSQSYLPPAYDDGFVYGNLAVEADTILIKAFLDPLCPDSRDSWKPLKKAAKHYGPRFRLVVNLFPLPYHDNAYFATRALHIVNAHNSSATFHLLESFFNHQEKFYNAQTRNLSRVSVIKRIVEFGSKSVGDYLYDALESGFSDSQTDIKTRISFKYGCVRGVYGTPFFFVNGFALSNAGSAIDYKGWRKIIDPLLGTNETISQESVLSF